MAGQMEWRLQNSFCRPRPTQRLAKAKATKPKGRSKGNKQKDDYHEKDWEIIIKQLLMLSMIVREICSVLLDDGG